MIGLVGCDDKGEEVVVVVVVVVLYSNEDTGGIESWNGLVLVPVR